MTAWKGEMIAPIHPTAADTLARAVHILSEVLASFDTQADSANLSGIHAARTAVADTLVRRDTPPPRRGPDLDALIATADSLARHPAASTALDAVPALPATPGWPGILAHIFNAPAWQTPGLRPLDDAPAWLQSVYARYLFASPPFFLTQAHELQWSAHLLAHLTALVRRLEMNPGSSASQSLAQLVLDNASRWPVVGSPEQIRLRFEALGRLRIALAPRQPAHARPATPAATPLRVAVVCDETAHASAGFDAAHLKTVADPERLEFIVHTTDTLPSDVSARLAELRSGDFDAVIFAGDLASAHSPLAALALHRVAPKQFATALCAHTTGLPEIDGFLGDASFASAAHSEHLAILPAALAFSPADTSASTADAPAPSRADLGLPETAQLLVAVAHPRHTTTAVRAAWLSRLQENPDASLIVFPSAADAANDAFLSHCEQHFGARLIVASREPLDSAAVGTLLRLCNAYLPSSAPGERAIRDLAHQHNLAVPDVPPRIDCLAFADALTSVLEIACREPGEPLIAPPAACDFKTRQDEGNHLLAFGRPDRAVVYLLAAIDDPQAGPDVWHDLAVALHANQQPADAIQALETCVRLAPDRLESWLLLADHATDFGHDDLVRDIVTVVRELAPADPRVTALVARLAS